MKNYIRIFFSALLLIWATPSKAEMSLGVGLIVGQVDSDGTETEGTAADTSTRSKSFEEQFAGVDLFAEYDFGGYTLGLQYIPIDKDVGDGSRVDSEGDDPAENDSGTRTASATVEDMYAVYANIPISGDLYGLLAYNQASVITTESLNASSYGNKDIDGYSVGFGFKGGAMKYELYYTDFEDFTITASGGNSNSVAADIDALTFRMSYGF
tara:strand:- start:724 stop:1356 length:633 start_codon:yes stop_codon:yes gene_type:complete